MPYKLTIIIHLIRRIFTLILLSVISLNLTFGQLKKSARIYHEEAEQALSKKNHARALELLNECLRIDPYFAAGYYTRGMVKEQLMNSDGALTDYNIYLEMRPDHNEVLFSRAILRFNKGQYELAKSDLQKLILLPAGETTTIFFQHDLYSSSANKIFTTQGSNKAYLFNYVGLTETMLKNFNAAIIAFDSAITLNPKDADQLVNRGLAKLSNEDFNGAKIDFQLALTLNQDHSLALYNLGVLAKTHGSLEDSEKLLNEAIERNPDLPYPHAQLAYLKYSRGDFKNAILEYDKAILIDSTDADYYLNRGLVKEKLKAYTSSLSDFTKAISIKPDFEKAWFSRGNVLTKLNRLEEAVEDYSLAIIYNPHYAAAYYNRALDRNKLGRTSEACEDLLKATEYGQAVDAKIKLKICKQ